MHTPIARTVVLIGTAALALLAGCSADPERDRLEGYWSDLGEGGQVTFCVGLIVSEEARAAVEDMGPGAVSFFSDRCGDLDITPRELAVELGIPL